jgi:hypothetical protein
MSVDDVHSWQQEKSSTQRGIATSAKTSERLKIRDLSPIQTRFLSRSHSSQQSFPRELRDTSTYRQRERRRCWCRWFVRIYPKDSVDSRKTRMFLCYGTRVDATSRDYLTQVTFHISHLLISCASNILIHISSKLILLSLSRLTSHLTHSPHTPSRSLVRVACEKVVCVALRWQ